MPSKVFISYSRKNADFVDQLHRDLENRGLDVWADDKIRLGDSWDRAIMRAIQDAQVIIIVLSPDANTSEWVQHELAFAQALNKPIVPVLVSEGQLNPSLAGLSQSYAMVDARRNYKDAIASLVKLLASPESLSPEK